MNYNGPGGCHLCGAMIGHRMIDLAPIDGVAGQCVCPLGMDVVPRAEHEKIRKELSTVRDHSDRTRSVMIEALLERDAMFENLTAVQARCTELLEEVRRLKIAAEALAHAVECWDADTAKDPCNCDEYHIMLAALRAYRADLDDCTPYCGAI